MKNVESQKIIEKIKAEKIMLESCWKLNWKSYLFWSVWISMLVLGSAFLSLTIFNFMDFHPSFLRYLGVGRLMHWLVFTAPIFWILLSLGALVFGILAFRGTKRGYRYSLLFVTSLTVLIVSMLGITFHFSRVNDRLREGFFPRGTGIMKMAFPIDERWQKPKEGFLAGEIKRMEEESFDLETMNGERWKVFYSSETKIIKKQLFCEDSQVGVVGRKKGVQEFEAEVVGPFPKREFEFGKKMKPGLRMPMMEEDLDQ